MASVLLLLMQFFTPWRRRRRYVAVGGLAIIVGVVRVAFLLGIDPTVRSWVGLGLPSCASAQISTPAAREGKCARWQGPFDDGTVYNVVDAGHVLHMPGYDVELLETQVVPTRVSNAEVWPSAYPAGRGQLVSFELLITSQSDAPLTFEGAGRDADLLINDPEGVGPATVSFPDLPDPHGGPGASLVDSGAIPPHITTIRWVSFVAPIWVESVLHQRAADLELYRAGDASHSYVGQIRLWKWANAAGQAALGLAPQGATSATGTAVDL